MAQTSEDDPRAPRTRAGSPPSLLLTLLGDYWWAQTDPLPSAALVDLLADFGVSDVAARAALSRMVKHGLLVSARSGRHTFYSLTPRAQAIMRTGAERIVAFGAGDGADWDGRWSLVAFSVPEANRSAREALRTRLRWLGFAPLYDALWISPHARHDEALAELGDLGVTRATAFVAACPPLPDAALAPESAWDLDGLAELYRGFVATWEPTHAALNKGAISPVEALVKRTELMDAWRAFPGVDPDLPRRLLPADWPRDRARDLFLDTYEQLGAPASVRVRQVISGYAPELADRVVQFSVVADPPGPRPVPVTSAVRAAAG
ncbi:PaaX family transcriptional regulator [Cellulomonas xiejunii]|uniref:PaaX family transcriptional regulator n=1 Tax=Cellulomonas xiejunii TaxID=2968083 RepID=A0ABY5KS02_9CELL|nr:PaaX family transcriptional regulator C-terminal domain-containing protein [Cellulomonas xiejunii]MCC2322182.1 PaaX family transcriptional regulator [Cellulomonas xiejunii]MCC2323175.1 PaaX family transcriptional regulator [Cellulomonas xiejunii]UUI72236.1 PaaX family transcriptional regulator [Cellulomonas xiejunii]